MLRRSHERIVSELRREHERDRRAWGEERERLLDRIMLLADKPPLMPFATDTQPFEPLPEFDLSAYPDLDPTEPDFAA